MNHQPRCLACPLPTLTSAVPTRADLYAFGFLLSAYFSLLQIGHMMLAREKYGNQAQKKHNEERINHDCLAAWRRLAMHVSEQTRQTFMDLMEAACGMDQTVHDNTCCYIESSKQHTNRTLSLKFSVLDNAFVFSLCMGLWCLNPYDLIFDTGDWWWLLFYLGVPHLLWAYEAILLQWLKVNSSAEGGPMSQQSASEKRWQIIRFVPKAIIFCLAFVAAAFENLLYQSSGIPNWCLEGDAAQVKKRLKTERCSKADSFLISVGQMHLTRTTWPFLIYGLFVGAHVVTYFALFASSGRQIEKQLDRSQSGGIGKKMQSKESRNIRTFIRILTAIFTAVSIVFAVFVIYPDVTMRSHIAFWMIWKTSLLAMLYYMYRTVRTPDSKTSHWVSTLFCCGEEVRDSVVETVDLHLNRLENKLRSFSDVVRNSRSGTRSSSALSFNASEESNSGIVLEGTPAGDSDDDEEDRGKGGGLVESSFVKSPLDHGGEEERPKAKGERVSIEMHDIPLTAEDTNITGANNEGEKHFRRAFVPQPLCNPCPRTVRLPHFCSND